MVLGKRNKEVKMRMALYAICFFLETILVLLLEYFKLPGWSPKLFGWGGGVLNGVVAVMLLLDWKNTRRSK